MTVTLSSFLQRFPNPVFKGFDDGFIEMLITEAYQELDAGFWGTKLDKVVGWYVADKLTYENYIATTGGITSGNVVSRSVAGEYSVNYAYTRASAESGFKTPYASLIEAEAKKITPSFTI